MGLDGPLQVGAFGERSGEVQVAVIPAYQEGHGIEAMSLEEVGLGGHLGPGDATQEVGPHVLGLGIGGVVGVAPDVQVEVVLGQGGVVHHSGVAGHILEGHVGLDDLLGVLGPQVVLGPAGPEVAVRVDEEHLASALGGLGALGPHDQDASRDTGAVEQVGGQPDHRLQQVVLDEALPDLLLLATPEEHAVGHDRGQQALGPEHGHHVLGEHQVGLLAGLGAPAVAEPLLELGARPGVVLAEGRVCKHPVESHQLPTLPVHGLGQGVFVLDVGVGDAVEQHVHLADGPDAAVVVLTVEGEVPGVAAVLFHVLLGQGEHPAGSHTGVVDPHAGLGVHQPNHQPDHVPGGVELTTLLARRVGELGDQELVGRAQQVGKLKVFVPQPVAVEVVHQVPELGVGDLGLAHLPVEVDVLDHALQGRVLLLQGRQGLVQAVADAAPLGGEGVHQELPPGPLGHVEVRSLIEARVIRPFRCLRLRPAPADLVEDDLLTPLVKHVRTPLQEQHPKDIFFKFRCIHLAPQDVGGGVEVAF